MLAMQPGEVLSIPISDYTPSTIRSYVSDLSFLFLRKYSAKRDRQTRIYQITRVR